MLPACCSNLSSSTWQLRSEDPWTTCFSAPERLQKNVLYGIEEGLARHRVRLIKLASVWGVNSLPRKPASNNRFRSSRLRRVERFDAIPDRPTRRASRAPRVVSWQNPIECLPDLR